MMSRIVVHNRLPDGSLENTTVCGEQTKQNSAHGGRNLDCSVDFSSVSGSATSNEANKSAMRREEWAITARQAVFRLAQMKYRYFVPEDCKQNAIFSGSSHQNRSCLPNI